MSNTEDRKIHLHLTVRMAGILARVCHREKRRRLKEAAKGDFIPAPGKFDANVMRAGVMSDVIAQLEPQIAESEREHAEATGNPVKVREAVTSRN